jgi:hypothetical protein
MSVGSGSRPSTHESQIGVAVEFEETHQELVVVSKVESTFFLRQKLNQLILGQNKHKPKQSKHKLRMKKKKVQVLISLGNLMQIFMLLLILDVE